MNKYLGNGNFSINGVEKKFKNLAFICDSKGVGAFLSILRFINTNESDKTKAICYYIAENENNFLLKKRLDVIGDREYITVHHHVVDFKNTWKGFAGEVTKDTLLEAIGICDDTGILVKCEEKMQKNVLALLKVMSEEKEFAKYSVKWDNIIVY